MNGPGSHAAALRPTAPTRQHLSLQLQGLVQGVGFRPHAARLAASHGLDGTIANSGSGLELELDGAREQLQAFVDDLLTRPPAQARIDHRQMSWGADRGEASGVRILLSNASAITSALVSPDLAICADCLAELNDPNNRRHGYPFISCTNCGPRYSLLEDLPFERAHTSLRHFPLCSSCRSEYDNPNDRRFHAQTISCPACGPQLVWSDPRNPKGLRTDAGRLRAAARALKQGAIVALKGVGGFQLLVDPSNAEAVAALRQRKGRPEKPLALLASEAWVRQHCALSPEEWRLWRSSIAPILLVRPAPNLAGTIAANVTGESAWLGVMRPCSGLQQLLLERCGGVLVATSANRSGEPIASHLGDGGDGGDGREAEGALGPGLADAVLTHNLAIANRIDDSVMRWAAGQPLLLRNGRGLAPLALPMPDQQTQGRGSTAAATLALGAQMKAALALRLPRHLLLSPELGDLGSCAAEQHLQSTTRQWLQRHQLKPVRIVCDQHPHYSSSQWARELAAGSPGERTGDATSLLAVQHHQAHLLAVMAEHQLSGLMLGVAWDGAGLGDDGSLWGGEALEVSRDGYRRIAMLRPWRLPGGERALREPRRSALGLLITGFGEQWREQLRALPALAWHQAFSADALQLLEQGLVQGINSPLSSSIGRLFDAVAALLNLAQCCSYEAQAASALEGLALEAVQSRCGEPWPLALPLDAQGSGEPLQWNWQPLLIEILEALRRGVPRSRIAFGFHQALAQAIAALASSQKRQQILLAGGCFQNGLLLELTLAALSQQGCTGYWPQQLPCNDGAIPIGQLLARSSLPITG